MPVTAEIEEMPEPLEASTSDDMETPLIKPIRGRPKKEPVPKVRPPRTAAQIEAFERMLASNKEKNVERKIQRLDKKIEKREELVAMLPETRQHLPKTVPRATKGTHPQPPTEEEEGSSDEEVVIIKKKPKKKKKTIIIEQSDSEEDDEQTKEEIRRVFKTQQNKKSKSVVKVQTQAPIRQAQAQNFFSD